MIEDMDAKAHAQAMAAFRAEHKRADACPLSITVGGDLVPLKDCDWALYTPCGCVQSVTIAVWGDLVVATEEDAWHEIYDTEPHAHKRVRERQIKRMKAEGYTVVPMLRTDAVAELRKVCPHPRQGKRPVEDAGSVDAYGNANAE